MFAEQISHATKVSRRDVEAKLVESRNRFLGFLRRRLSSSQDADDVFQDFCVKVLRHHSQIQSYERVDAWLGTILRHTLTDHYRRQATQDRSVKAYAIETIVTRQEAASADESACSCIVGAMTMLKRSQAELLTRIDLRGEPRKSVAADLGLNLNSLGVQVHRSRAALKKKIAEVCPVCGDGGFMTCERDHSRDMRPLSITRQSVMPAPV